MKYKVRVMTMYLFFNKFKRIVCISAICYLLLLLLNYIVSIFACNTKFFKGYIIFMLSFIKSLKNTLIIIKESQAYSLHFPCSFIFHHTGLLATSIICKHVRAFALCSSLYQNALPPVNHLVEASPLSGLCLSPTFLLRPPLTALPGRTPAS